MTWAYIIVLAVVLILGIALAPKPPAPKAAEISDFDFPTAEEGRPIPVLFGEIDITGANVLWYGDLEVKPIKKRSGFSKSTVGYKYHIGIHMGLCHAPVDMVKRIAVGDKQVWSGSATNNATANINLPDLFGGEKREGGIVGNVNLCFGADSQTANTYLSTKLAGVFPGIPIPAFRGILGAVVNKTYIGTSAYAKPWSFRVLRIKKGWYNDDVWYEAKAQIDQASGAGGDHVNDPILLGLMNPIHIVYQTLTDPRWGMGVDPELVDDVSFMACADRLMSEGFGLALLWNQSNSIESFLQIILDHIAGGLTLNNSTGKYEMILVRGDYDIEDLESYDESDILQIVDYQRQGWGETVNEISIVYRSPQTRKDTTVTQQDMANVEAQGARVPAIINMQGIARHGTAREVCARELVSRVTPLSKVTFEVNRRAWATRYGGLFRLYWSARDIEGTVYRLLKISKGTLQKGMIRIEALEDIYALGVTTSIGLPDAPADDGEQTPPETPPDSPDPGNGVVSATETDPPVDPQPGDSYYIPEGATGDWAGHDGELADWDEDSGIWAFSELPDGYMIYETTTNENYQIQDGELVPFGGGGSITVVDIDDIPDEEISPVDTIGFEDAEVTDLGDGNIVVKVTPTTTKGDLVTRTSTGVDRQPIGVEGTVLRARAASPTGLAWEPTNPVGEGASAARAYRNASQAIADSTLTAITWPVEAFDTDAYHSTSVNTSRFVAPLDGKYIVGCSIKWDSNTSGTRSLYVVVNGGTSTRRAGSYLPAANGLVQHMTDTLELEQGDYIEFYAYQDSGGSRDIVSLEQVTSAFIARVGVTAAPMQMRGATWVRSAGEINVPTTDIDVCIPVNGVIVGWSIGTKGGSGACVIDVWKATQLNYPPDVGDSICASNKPTISANIVATDDVLTGWTTVVTAGEWLTFHLESSSNFSAIFFQLRIRETQ